MRFLCDRRQSSANIGLRTVDETGREVDVYYRNSRGTRGPRTVPCGTPEVTGDSEDVCPWLRSLRKLVI